MIRYPGCQSNSVFAVLRIVPPVVDLVRVLCQVVELAKAFAVVIGQFSIFGYDGLQSEVVRVIDTLDDDVVANW